MFSDIPSYERHELSSDFPIMKDEMFTALVRSMKDIATTRIIIFEGRIRRLQPTGPLRRLASCQPSPSSLGHGRKPANFR